MLTIFISSSSRFIDTSVIVVVSSTSVDEPHEMIENRQRASTNVPKRDRYGFGKMTVDGGDLPITMIYRITVVYPIRVARLRTLCVNRFPTVVSHVITVTIYF